MTDLNTVKLHKPALYRLIWAGDTDVPCLCDDCPFYRMKTSRSAYEDPESRECALLGGIKVYPNNPQCEIAHWKGQAAIEAQESVAAAERLDRQARSLQSEIVENIVSAAISGDKAINFESLIAKMELNPSISEALSRVLDRRS